MELDDLKTAWRELDRRLDASQAITLRVLKELKLDRTRSALRRLSALLVFELLSGVLATLLLGSFLADHHDSARFAIPAVVLDVAAVFTIVASPATRADRPPRLRGPGGRDPARARRAADVATPRQPRAAVALALALDAARHRRREGPPGPRPLPEPSAPRGSRPTSPSAWP